MVVFFALPSGSLASVQEQDLILSGDIDSLMTGVVKGLQIQKNIIDNLKGEGLLVGFFFLWLVFVAYIWIRRVSDNGAEIYNFISWLAVTSIVLFILFSTIQITPVYYDFEKELNTSPAYTVTINNQDNKSKVEHRDIQVEASAINTFVTLASEIAHVVTKAILGPFVGSDPQTALKAMNCKHIENIYAKAFTKLLDSVKAENNNLTKFYFLFDMFEDIENNKKERKGKFSCNNYNCYEIEDTSGNIHRYGDCEKKEYCEQFVNFLQYEVDDCVSALQHVGDSQQSINAVKHAEEGLFFGAYTAAEKNFLEAIKPFMSYDQILKKKFYDPTERITGQFALGLARDITSWIGKLWLKIQPTMKLHLQISFVVQAMIFAVNIVVTPFIVLMFLVPVYPGVGINFKGFVKLIVAYLLLFLWYPFVMFIKFLAYGKLI